MLTKRNLRYLRRFVPYSIKKASAIMTISKNTAAEVSALTGYRGDLFVVYPPASVTITRDNKIPYKYMLLVGTIEPRKNVEVAVAAYNKLPTEVQHENKLIIAGRLGWLDRTDIAKFRSSLEDNPNVIWRDDVSTPELGTLYSGAALLLFTSLYEGYGMPLAEAMLAKLPVVALDTPINHETLSGYNKSYFAANATELSDLIQKVLEKKNGSRPAPGNYSTRTNLNMLYRALLG